MKKFSVFFACSLAFAAAVVTAQQTPTPAAPAATPPPLPQEINNMYNNISGFISKSADLVPQDKWIWAPTPEVRSFARMFGHLTDDNNGACWTLGGLTARPANVDAPNSAESGANKMARADLVKAWADSVALCQKAFAALTPANMLESAGGRGTRSKVGNLMYNTSHINEHYGNLVTYLRLNGIVPPSSAPRGGGPGE